MRARFCFTLLLLFSITDVLVGQTSRGLGRVPTGGKFKDLGVPVQFLSGAQGQAGAPRKGRNQKIYTACAETDGPMYILEADPDTGATQLYECPVQDDRQVFGFTLGVDNIIFLAAGAHVKSSQSHTKGKIEDVQ